MSLLRTENGLTTDIFVVKCTGGGLVVKRPGVLSKVQMLNLVLGVGVFFRAVFLGRGCDEALFSDKKGFSVGGGNSVNGGFGKDSTRKAIQ